MYDIAESPAWQSLFSLASEQAGYFTRRQAAETGYGSDLLRHHVQRGRFIRVRRGLYRLRDYPSSLHEEMMAAWLSAGRDTSLISHESALVLHELSDVVPDLVHLTISRARRGLPRPDGVTYHTVLHLPTAADVTVRSGMRVTAPLRTLLDVAETGTASEQVRMAVEQAVRRGWVTSAEALTAARKRGKRVEALISSSVGGA